MTSGRTGASRRSASIFLAVVVVVGGLIGAGTPALAQGGLGATLRARLQAVVDEARSSEAVPGLSAAVVTPDDTWTGVAGRSRLDPDVWVGTKRPYAIASVTKTFVAATILQLREEGKLSLGDRLSRWETRVPNAGRITIRQMLSHTSGIRDMWRHPKYRARVEDRPNYVWTYAEVRAMIGAPRFAPGTGYEYSNSNYLLLGRIVELETGNSLAREIRRRFLEPLGLDDTWYQGVEEGPREVAMGYRRVPGAWRPESDGTGLRPTTSIATFFGSSGAMVSTARDVATWAQALYSGKVLRDSSLELMTTFNRHDYGLGARRKPMGGRMAWGHGGSLDGFETSMWYIPDIRSAVVVIWNRRDRETDGVADRLATRVVNALDPDTTPPSMGAPRIGLRTGALVAAGPRAPVAVSWAPARDSQGAIARYELRRRSGSGAWQSVRLASGLARGATVDVSLGRTTVLAVRAIDDRGNASDWIESRPVVARYVDASDASVSASAGWRSRAAPDSIGGRVLSSRTVGSRLTLGFRAHAVAIVAPRARALTRAGVRVDARPRVVVDLHASSRSPRRAVLTRRWSGTATRHSIRIYVREASTPRIDIDGFLILEAPAAP